MSVFLLRSRLAGTPRTEGDVSFHDGPVKQKRRVAVVIPTFNRDDLLEACLEHLSSQTFRDFRVIVVDNSLRSSFPTLLGRYENVEWLPLLSNLGTAVAFNRGIAAAGECEFVFLLNNDAEMELECLAHLVEALEKDNSYSVAVPKLLQWSDPRYLDGVGDEILLGGGAYRVGHGELDAGQYDCPRVVFGACAAAALYRVSLFQDIGGFDEDFFAYREDVELGLRAQLKGHRCIYVPAARVHHHGSATMGRTAHSWIIRLSTRNQILAILKTYPAASLLSLLPQLLLFQILWLGFALQTGTLFAACIGLLDSVRFVPKMLRKRRKIQSQKVITAQCFSNLLRGSEMRIWQWHTSAYTPRPALLLALYFQVFRPRGASSSA